MKTIYNLIKEKIHKNPIIVNSVLSKAHPWKRSHYVILSEIIKEHLSKNEELKNEKKFELGTSISYITLQRFFENSYDFKTHNDLRFLKTLDKICIFLGYKNLNDFIEKVKEEKIYNEADFSKEKATDLIYKFCHLNFEFYKQFPTPKISIFKNVIFSNSPFLERIKTYSKELAEKKLVLVTKNNRSNYEIFDTKIISEEDDKIVIKTQEFWNLVFMIEGTEEEYIVNELDPRVYFIKKMNEEWKIWDNYDPDFGTLQDKIKRSQS